MFEKLKQKIKEFRDSRIEIKFAHSISLKEVDWQQTKKNTDGSVLVEKISLKGLDIHEEED